MSVFVFVIFFSLALALYAQLSRSTQAEFRSMFESEQDDKLRQVENFQLLYRNTLSSVQGLFNASEDVTRSEWATFSKDVGVFDNPAVLAFAYVERVPKSGLPKFIDSIGKDSTISPEGLPGFKIFPEKDKDEYLPIKYVVPLGEETRNAIGFDIAEGQVSVPDMLDARDNNLITSTRDFKVNFLDRNGIVVFKAIYEKDMPQNTVEERRTALKGYAVIVFDAQMLLDSIFSSAGEGYVGVSVYGSDSSTSSPAIYESEPLIKKLPAINLDL